MAQDLGDKLKSILSDPQMMESFSELLKSEKADDNQNSGDISSQLQSVISQLGGDNDKRINLLNALKPYMKGNRAQSIDKAVRIIKMTKLGSVLKDL